MSDAKNQIIIKARDVPKEHAPQIKSALESIPQHRETTFNVRIGKIYSLRADVALLENPQEVVRRLAEELQSGGCRGTVFYSNVEDFRCWHSRVTSEGVIRYVRRVSDI
jgi:hypothetical protein